jgi:hypothetical protein
MEPVDSAAFALKAWVQPRVPTSTGEQHLGDRIGNVSTNSERNMWPSEGTRNTPTT